MITTLSAHCPAIECAGCANAIARSLGKLAGVHSINVDISRKRVAVQFDDEQASEEAVRAHMEQAGFPAASE